MNRFIGTKVIQAEPEASAFEGIPGYRVVYPDGYTSWSPASAFESAYRRTDSMTFGDAVHMLKLGHRVARAGWNGKGMWLVLVKQMPAPTERLAYCVGGGGHFFHGGLLPWIGMKTVQDQLVPWLASQTDVLAEDWQLVE